jgi:hypothetical protein
VVNGAGKCLSAAVERATLDLVLGKGGNMKNRARLLFVAVAAVAVVGISSAPSEAAKKRMAKCDVSRACSANCKGNTCEMRRCDPDGKTYVHLPLLTCAKGTCPPAC